MSKPHKWVVWKRPHTIRYIADISDKYDIIKEIRRDPEITEYGREKPVLEVWLVDKVDHTKITGKLIYRYVDDQDQLLFWYPDSVQK